MPLILLEPQTACCDQLLRCHLVNLCHYVDITRTKAYVPCRCDTNIPQTKLFGCSAVGVHVVFNHSFYSLNKQNIRISS